MKEVKGFKLKRDNATIFEDEDDMIKIYQVSSLIDGKKQNFRVISYAGAHSIFEENVAKIQKRHSTPMEKQSFVKDNGVTVTIQQYIDDYVLTVCSPKDFFGNKEDFDMVYYSEEKCKLAFESLRNDCKSINF